MKRLFWIVGGLFKNTRFEELAEGRSEERYGPFKTFEAAEAEWQRLSWQKVDECQVFYRIVDEPA